MNNNEILIRERILGSLDGLYLDWVNNFLTIEKFAEYYGFTVSFATAFIKEYREMREAKLSNK